ncbi:MAG: hydantoinase B/oxoprolinase family protein [Candidatus Binatota bacterium]
MVVKKKAASKRAGKRLPARMEIDPLTLSTVWHSLQRICREMRRVIERTSQSFLISQLKDISVGIWDGEGNTIAIPVGLPIQFVGAKFSVKYILNEYRDNVYPGDVFLANDPYKGYSCHPPDWGFFRPIFYKKKLVFWTLARAHVEDTGAAFPGAYFSDPYDVHSEGILIPGVKVMEKGKEQRDVLRLIWNNVRLSEGVRIDSYSMIAATQLAELRLGALVERYGIGTVQRCVSVMQDRTERAIRACIKQMKDGTYYGESSTDDDGYELDVPVTVRCEITVKGDKLTLDFSQSDKQRRGFVNCSYPSTYSNAVAASILFFDPALAEYHNEGTMRAIEVIAPEGLVVNAKYPAPMGGAPVSMGGNILEAVMMAMSEAVPGRAAAGWGRRYGQYIYGINPRTDGLYVFPGYHAEGGAGAVAGYDGYQGSASIGTLGEISRPNTEDVEIRYPWKVISRQFRMDSSGAGKWRGGPGFHWEALNLGGEAGMHTGAGQGETTFSHGALGGKQSPPNTCYILRNGERIRAKVHRLHQLRGGDHVVKDTGGGGGIGRPEERDPQAVWEDVYINELVTIEGAREIYKVAIDPATRQIDWNQTKSLRAAAGAGREV